MPGPGLLRSFLMRGDAYCRAMPQRIRPTSDRRAKCLVPHLIGAFPLTVELVGDALGGDLVFCYVGVVRGLSFASEGLLRGNILEEH